MDLEDENNIKNVLSFKTDYFLPDSFDSPHAFAFFKINPSQINWNYTILSCFLNQFSILKKRKSNSYYTKTDKDVYESPNEGSKIAEISPQQSYDSRENVSVETSVEETSQPNPDDIYQQISEQPNSSPLLTTTHSNSLNASSSFELRNFDNHDDDDQNGNPANEEDKKRTKPIVYELSIKISSKITVYATLHFVQSKRL